MSIKPTDSILGCCYEMKYHISESQAVAVTQFIKPYLKVDRYCKLQKSGDYPIVSLYFDSSNLQLCQESMRGHKNPFKLRIRSNTDQLDYPRFFEIKRWMNTIIINSRARIMQRDIPTLLAGLPQPPQNYTADTETINQFQLYMNNIIAKPAVLIRYMRRAYEGNSENRVRVTFDRELAYNVIDRKWQKDFGSKANYRISDVVPSPNDIQIEKAVPASGILTLRDAVALVTAHNREYQAQKEELYIKALDLRLTRHEFESQFFAGASGGYTADRNDEVLGTEANLGFTRLLAGGTRISTIITAAWADVLTGNLRSGVASILSATVTQPLLRGSDRRVVLENLTQAERDTLYQVRLFNRFRKTFVVSIISQYHGILQKFDAVQNAKRNYNTLTSVSERVEKLANAGRVPQLELERVRQEKLQALYTYIMAEKEYKHALDEFKIAMSLPTTAEFRLDEDEFEALRAAEMIVPEFSEAEVVEAALLQRLDLVNSADAIIDAQRKVFVAADSLRAELNLVVSANTISARRANRQTLGWLREEYGLGFQLDLPLDRVPEQHIYRIALITLSQRQREYEQAADIVTLQVRQAHRDMVEAADRYKVLSEGLELAQKRFKNTYLLLQYGRVNSRRVLNAQDDLFDAQNAAAQALVGYTVATLNFYRDTGVLLCR